MKKLILPLTFEEVNQQFESSEVDARMVEFVSPLIDAESEVSKIAASISNSGKLSFILGHPGVGKSTFLHSLNWRKHIPIRKVIDVDVNEFLEGENLNSLFNEISSVCKRETPYNDQGISAIILNYLESIDEYEESTIKAFFRRLNGLLRTQPILILWPVTSEDDVSQMLEYTKQVAGTLFTRDNQIIRITGPKLEDYVDIANSTIKVMNDGSELSDFGLTSDDLLETFTDFQATPKIEQNLREYYSQILSKWETNSNYLKDLKLRIPKPTEVWFVFPFKEAESIVGQFSRRGNRVEDSWTAISDKFSDYITGNAARSARWDAKRLQLALHGVLKTRILYHPTNLVVTTSYSFTDKNELLELISNYNPPNHWSSKSATTTSVKKSPIYKQLIGENFPPGKRKGGPALQALDTANPIYKEIVSWISSAGSGSDTHLNKAFGMSLIEAGIKDVLIEKEHPWIKGIYPDLQIDLGHKIICIEFHYTMQDEPYVIANYVLKKLDSYMAQIEKL